MGRSAGVPWLLGAVQGLAGRTFRQAGGWELSICAQMFVGH